MRLRTTCRCGSEFEARGVVANVSQLWNVWLGFHQHHHGLKGFSVDDDGKVTTTATPNEWAKAEAGPDGGKTS